MSAPRLSRLRDQSISGPHLHPRKPPPLYNFQTWQITMMRLADVHSHCAHHEPKLSEEFLSVWLRRCSTSSESLVARLWCAAALASQVLVCQHDLMSLRTLAPYSLARSTGGSLMTHLWVVVLVLTLGFPRCWIYMIMNKHWFRLLTSQF